MLNIGLLGSDNSHADRFAELLNRSDHPYYFANDRCPCRCDLGAGT
ncbi:MAG: hypothetical protein R2867_04075 [Caldilineaceae bacterium]